MTESKAKEFSLGDYYSAVQLRADRWSNLHEITKQLLQRHSKGKDTRALVKKAESLMDSLAPIEMYWAFPGYVNFENLRHLLLQHAYEDLVFSTRRIFRALLSGSYRRRSIPLMRQHGDTEEDENDSPDNVDTRVHSQPYFEVLIVDELLESQVKWLRQSLRGMRREEDQFIYESFVLPSVEDALIAILFNHNIQTVVVRPGLTLKSVNKLQVLQSYLVRLAAEDVDSLSSEEHGVELCRLICKLRPEIDTFLVTNQSVEDIAGRDLGSCRRVFYNQEDFTELHLNILRGVWDRYQTPFFTALKEYSRQPTGVFHALPISRGKSITRSHWIQDMGKFYGKNIFMAETSATSGGLDSLLEPQGPIKVAQELASRAFGSKRTYFATNGTSTCNKIVVQALVRPGDIVLVDRDCHKSHHYGMVLSGANVIYLDSYPLHQYSMYGAVPLHVIKAMLLELKQAGKLDRVRMLLLTNCTFDGIVYNVERFMEECLAIKPDLVFLWDEAWFAFARFGPTYRQRTAMNAAAVLREKFSNPTYLLEYQKQAQELADADDQQLINTRLLANPEQARVRVYSTQSTHKTLTALRQGSMLHIHDQDYKSDVEQSFHEAYMTHTSTSPNYQIIASLDLGRRQVELEGFEFVQKQVEAAMSMRRAIQTHPLLKKYFKVLTAGDMIPEKFRESKLESYYDPEHGWNEIWQAWAKDEFTLDATRVTLLVGGTGCDGETFKTKVLMDKYGIQINKTSRNTVLFMTNIGTTRSSVAYLIEVLVKIATEIDERQEDSSVMERKVFDKKVNSLLNELPPLPDFSRFHDKFRCTDASQTLEGDIRSAFFLAYDEKKCEYFPINDGSMEKVMATGREIVSSSFIIPYPPGFPILVPGQVVSTEILDFMRALDVTEIHGYQPELGLRVFTAEAVQ